MVEYAYWITQALLSIAVLCAVYRVFAGPSVLDRVISVDVMLIIVASMLFTDMAVNDHHDFILFALATAVIGFLGAVAIARYVAVRSPEETRPAAGIADRSRETAEVEPEVATGPDSESVTAAEEPAADGPDVSSAGGDGSPEDEDSSSWFAALVDSRKASGQDHRDGPAEAQSPAQGDGHSGQDGSGRPRQRGDSR